MVVCSSAKMKGTQLYVLLISQATLFIFVSGQNELPQEGECGNLNTNYYNNQKSLAEIDEYPWMGRIQYQNTINNTFIFKCHAVLITRHFVIAAAVCFEFEEEPYRVYLGDWDIGKDISRSDCDDNGRCAPVPQAFEIEEIIIHRNFSKKLEYNNIALMKLSKPVTYSDFIRPICLPKRDVVQKNFNNQLLEVTGWYFYYSAPKMLAKTFVRVISLKICEAKVKNITVDKEKHICAYTCPGKNVFSVNSALMDIISVDGEPGYYYLVGLNVHGLKDCSEAPDVYVRVDRYLDWIYANIVE